MGGTPSGPQEMELLEERRDFLTSITEKTGVGMLIFVREGNGGNVPSSGI